MGDQGLFENERQAKILEILRQGAHVRVSDLSQQLDVSENTIRRDLDKLHQMGEILRTHGGAVTVKKNPPQLFVVKRIEENLELKQRIGRAAASLVKDGETVFIGSGTTTLEVARSLMGRTQLTIISNSLLVINLLVQQEGLTVIETGGFLNPSELSFIGHLTEQALDQLRPQKSIMGIRALSIESGLTNENLTEVSTDRVILRTAPEVILVADHTKIGKVSTALVAPINAIHKLVTDRGAPPEFVDRVKELGIEVIIC